MILQSEILKIVFNKGSINVRWKPQNIAEKIREDLNKCKNILYLWIKTLNIAKMITFPEWIYRFNMITIKIPGFPGGSDGKESACEVGDPGSIPGSERSLGEGNGYPLQCSCLENSMDRGAWWGTIHGVAKIQTWLSDSHTHTQTRMIS